MKKFYLLITIFLSTFQDGVARVPIPVKKPIQIETLCRGSSSWDGKAYTVYPGGRPEVTVLKITIPANSGLNWHKHPMLSAAYVVSGTLTIEKKSNGKKRTLLSGQACLEMINEFHRGWTGNQGVVLIVFYAGRAGMPLSIPWSVKNKRIKNI